MMGFITEPDEIEKKSFEIITEGLAGKRIDPRNAHVVKRVIHTTADFDYADSLVFSEGAAALAAGLLKGGATIITDTRMAEAGVNKRCAAALGCSVHCFIDAPDVAEAARAGGVTRARAAVDKAAALGGGKPLIFAVGNAPTALIRLHELMASGACRPAFIIGAPVGFVNVTESKELILASGVPHIVARGQKGGSNVAAAICNALLYGAAGRRL